MTRAEIVPNRFERRRIRNREALLKAAVELFQSRGVRATKLEDICDRADVAPRTFFNHFETREHLYRAILVERAKGMAAMLDVRAEAPEPFDENLRTFLAAIAGWLAAHPAYREMVREMLALGFGGEREGTQLLQDALVRFVASGVGRGEVTDRHEPEVLADLLMGAVVTSLRHWCEDEFYDLPQGLGLAVAAFLDLCTPQRRSAPKPRSKKRRASR